MDSFNYKRLRPEKGIYLDANESPFNAPDNRYPVNELIHLQEQWGQHEHIPSKCIYFCNGTEEAVDLSMRIFATPGTDRVLSVSPTRSIYGRRAAINRLAYHQVALDSSDYSLNIDDLLESVDQSTKIIYLCSPNSPTGKVVERASIEMLLDLFDGYVVIDESYIDFVPSKTVLPLLNKYRKLIILRSFSHAWSSAGARLAAVVAHPDVIAKFVSCGLTHPISSFSIRYMEGLFKRRLDVYKWTRQIIDEREKVAMAFRDLPQCVKVYPSEANFLFIRFTDSEQVYKHLLSKNIMVRHMGDCLRITIGLPGENSILLGALRQL